MLRLHPDSLTIHRLPNRSATRGPLPSPDERVSDINHAKAAHELLNVPGMTPSWAGRIVRFRPYRTKLDLLDRGVLSGSNVWRSNRAIAVIAHREKQVIAALLGQHRILCLFPATPLLDSLLSFGPSPCGYTVH